jgi:3-deoxy-manno-octulosonate cytidylyltransferase (CMP-KDO synthetase)
MTSPGLASGTDRVHAVAQQLARENGRVEPVKPVKPNDIFVNIQGDEPLLRPEHFRALLLPFQRAQVDVSTLMTRCPVEEIDNPNVVKVVVNRDGNALYFSRAMIPYDRDGSRRGDIPYWKHLGLYAYRKHILDRFPSLPGSKLEAIERLEQLRLLENGISIHVEPVEHDTVGVDTEADLKMAAVLLRARQLLAP